jgi:acyl-CoA dehydrogenase
MTDLGSRGGADRIRAAAGEVAQASRAGVRSTDEAASFPAAALQAMRDTGLLGLMVPEEYGGLGGGIDDLIETNITLARVDLSVAMILAMHCQQAAALVRYAGPRLRAELLPEIAAGRRYLASVTTEAGKGGRLLTSDAALTERAGRLALDRNAPIVTGGLHADGFLITMQAPGAVHSGQVSLVYAHREQLELAEYGTWQPLGMRASHSVGLRLRGELPADQVVGEHGGFHTVAVTLFAPLAHLGWSACWLGTAAGALSRTLRELRVRDRAAGGGILGSDLLLVRLATARRLLDSVHALLAHTSRIVQATEDLSAPSAQLLINALKVTAAEDCYRAVDILVEAVGMRDGYLKDSPTGLEQALRDLRSASLNYHNDRILLADGKLVFLDPEVSFPGLRGTPSAKAGARA